MTLIISAFPGIAAAVVVHWFTWWVRLHHRLLSVVLGVFGALGVTALGMIYVYASDIAHIVQPWLILFWGVALAIGILQAASIPAPWWAGILGMLFELALGFSTISAFNLSLQRLWDRFPETFPHPSEVLEQFIYGFLISLLVLALLRPVARIGQRRR